MTQEQIEKAAIEFAERENEISDIDKIPIYKGFYWGANWRINSVWHNMKEKPNFKKLPILLELKKRGQDSFY